MFQFDSLQAFVEMGGHGVYVWSAYLVTLAIMLWLLRQPRVREKQLIKQIRRQQANAARRSNLEP